MSAFDRLLSQIDAFIRKFYKNQLVKGLLLFVGVLILSYLLVITLEYFGRFSTAVRGTLLFSFIGVNLYIFVKYIFIPTMKLRSFGNRIDRYQASRIIGQFFPKISDRLLNTLQLSDRMDQHSADFELLNASVQQRSATMSVIPFSDAIDIGENRKYLTWVLPAVSILFILGFFSPSLLTEGTERVVNFTETFEIPAPFTFNLTEGQSTIEEGEDFTFEVTLEGTALPEKVYIKSEQGLFLLDRVSKNVFQGTLTQVRETTHYRFEANGFTSEQHTLGVISKTALGKLQATLVYPAYLGKENEVIENAGDLVVNEGTQIKWSVRTKNSKGAEFWIGDKKRSFNDEGFALSEKVKESTTGKIVLRNKQTNKRDTTAFLIDVIKDEYPSIQVDEVQDTLKDGIRYFSGLVSDDYGLSNLTFVYTITNIDGKKRTERMPASRVVGTESPFDFAVDFRREKLQLEDEVEYYFVVSDNDGVNGSKSTKSRVFQYKLPTLEELNEERGEEQEKAKKDMSDLVKKAEKFKEDVERIRKEAINTKQSNWNNENQVNQLQEDHESLLEDLQQLQEEMNNSMEEKNQLSEMDKQLMEQQELINDLLEELMDDELKELLEELEKLMKEQNKNALEKNLEELEMSSEDMKKQLDRSLEMLKKMQVNEKIDDIEEELKKLAKEQDELRKETEDKKNISEDDIKKQDEINDAFDKLKEDMQELDSLNSELDRPMDLDEQKEKSEEVTEDLNDSKENLEKDKGKKAGESQKDASKKMEEMAESLAQMQASSNQQQQQEDMDMLRNILESLVLLSFDQEEVMGEFSKVADTDPAYRTYGRKQRKIVDNTKIVNDSLLALAERQPRIAKFIDKELNQINVNHELILEEIDEHERKQLTNHQQFVMTSFNNLALMLNESLQQMQQQMQSMMQGSGSCDKPGGKGQGKPKSGSNPSPGDMKEMLKKQLESMKKGSNPGGKEPGEKPGSGQGSGPMGLGNKEMAKMAAEQSAIRRKLEQLRNELNKDGKGSGNRLNPLIRELEEQENDLINKRTGSNMVERQQRILTRLLEHEKALIERGLDEKRESKEGKNDNIGNQIRFDEYNKEKLRQIELLRSVDPAYRKYYKDRANEYFNRVL